MSRCLELASTGFLYVRPNPMVGCVIVCDDQVIGEGCHRVYGESHAEVLAIESVKDKELLKDSTLYVNLEPCSHYGKTPPCSDLIINNDLQRVVIAMKDPNPLVGGRGIKQIMQAGITVDLNILKDDAVFLNRRFVTFHKHKRPYVILKWAQTKDGFIADKNYESKWISNRYSRVNVHKWRTEEQAILVGTNTARIDNPQLTARDWDGPQPLRLVIDKELNLDKSLSLFDKSTPTVIFNFLKTAEETNLTYFKLNEDKNTFDQILEYLYDRQIQSLIVEGGSALLNSIIKKGQWDESRIFIGNKSFKDGVVAPALNLCADNEVEIKDNRLRIFYNKQEYNAF